MKLLIVAPDGFVEDTEAAACARGLAQAARKAGAFVEVLAGGRPDSPDRPEARLTVDGLLVTLHPTPDAAGREAFLRLLDASMDRLAPDRVIVAGAGRAAGEALARARARGAATAVSLHDLRARSPGAFEHADAVLVPSRFAADYHAEAFGLRCSVVPTLVDPARALVDRPEPRFATFVDPSAENGAYVFARIADELGRLRPDIPILIVGTRGSGATLAGSGIDVFARGNVSLMERTASPRDHWRLARLAIVPTLAWDASPRRLAEAIANGIPAVASDRGQFPEVQAGLGASLSIPGRITPATKTLPTPAEVAPWVEAIARLWDSMPSAPAPAPLAGAGRGEGSSLAPSPLAGEGWGEGSSLAPSPLAGEGWGGGTTDVVAALRPQTPPFLDILRALQPNSSPRITSPPGRSKSVVLVPFFSTIDRPCEESLRKLEAAGVRVVRSEGCPQIDVARNMLISDALNAGAESILFIDADLGFDPSDALRLLAGPEPVVSGVYAKKRQRALASVFDDGINEVTFGEASPGPYPLKYAAGGFLRIKAEVLRRMIDELGLPACNATWGRRDWPFFMPMAAPMPDGSHHYLGEDWAFSFRLRQMGITPLADTSIRLWHHGPHAYGWEDAGAEAPRHPSYIIKIEGPRVPGFTRPE